MGAISIFITVLALLVPSERFVLTTCFNFTTKNSVVSTDSGESSVDFGIFFRKCKYRKVILAGINY